MIVREEVRDQLEYEIEDQATYGLENPISLNEIEIKEIAELIMNNDKSIVHLFNMDPQIVVIHRDNEKYDWADFYNQLCDVIEWYKMNPLIKIFSMVG